MDTPETTLMWHKVRQNATVNGQVRLTDFGSTDDTRTYRTPQE